MVYFIRSASERDVAAIAELLAASWRATYVPLYGAEKVEELISAWHSPEAIAANIARTDGEYLLADSGSRIGGMAYASISGKGDVKSVRLHQLYVHPECQREGIGRDLFAEVETCFPGAHLLTLEVDPENSQAIAFYRGVGLVETGQTENCSRDQSGIPAVIMEKRLSAEPF